MDCTQVLPCTPQKRTNTYEKKENIVVATLCINEITYDIFNRENSIGRGDDCDIVIKNEAISNHHAIIEGSEYEEHTIYDLGSTNNTKLGKTLLKPNVRYFIGDGASLHFADELAVYKYVCKTTSPNKLQGSQNFTIPETPEKSEASRIPSPEALELKDNEIIDTSDIDMFDEPFEEQINSTLKENNGSVKLSQDEKNSGDIYGVETQDFDMLSVENNCKSKNENVLSNSTEELKLVEIENTNDDTLDEDDDEEGEILEESMGQSGISIYDIPTQTLNEEENVLEETARTVFEGEIQEDDKIKDDMVINKELLEVQKDEGLNEDGDVEKTKNTILENEEIEKVSKGEEEEVKKLLEIQEADTLALTEPIKGNEDSFEGTTETILEKSNNESSTERNEEKTNLSNRELLEISNVKKNNCFKTNEKEEEANCSKIKADAEKIDEDCLNFQGKRVTEILTQDLLFQSRDTDSDEDDFFKNKNISKKDDSCKSLPEAKEGSSITEISTNEEIELKGKTVENIEALEKEENSKNKESENDSKNKLIFHNIFQEHSLYQNQPADSSLNKSNLCDSKDEEERINFKEKKLKMSQMMKLSTENVFSPKNQSINDLNNSISNTLTLCDKSTTISSSKIEISICSTNNETSLEEKNKNFEKPDNSSLLENLSLSRLQVHEERKNESSFHSKKKLNYKNENFESLLEISGKKNEEKVEINEKSLKDVDFSEMLTQPVVMDKKEMGILEINVDDTAILKENRNEVLLSPQLMNKDVSSSKVSEKELDIEKDLGAVKKQHNTESNKEEICPIESSVVNQKEVNESVSICDETEVGKKEECLEEEDIGDMSIGNLLTQPFLPTNKTNSSVESSKDQKLVEKVLVNTPIEIETEKNMDDLNTQPVMLRKESIGKKENELLMKTDRKCINEENVDDIDDLSDMMTQPIIKSDQISKNLKKNDDSKLMENLNIKNLEKESNDNTNKDTLLENLSLRKMFIPSSSRFENSKTIEKKLPGFDKENDLSDMLTQPVILKGVEDLSEMLTQPIIFSSNKDRFYEKENSKNPEKLVQPIRNPVKIDKTAINDEADLSFDNALTQPVLPEKSLTKGNLLLEELNLRKLPLNTANLTGNSSSEITGQKNPDNVKTDLPGNNEIDQVNDISISEMLTQPVFSHKGSKLCETNIEMKETADLSSDKEIVKTSSMVIESALLQRDTGCVSKIENTINEQSERDFKSGNIQEIPDVKKSNKNNKITKQKEDSISKKGNEAQLEDGNEKSRSNIKQNVVLNDPISEEKQDTINILNNKNISIRRKQINKINLEKVETNKETLSAALKLVYKKKTNSNPSLSENNESSNKKQQQSISQVNDEIKMAETSRQRVSSGHKSLGLDKEENKIKISNNENLLNKKPTDKSSPEKKKLDSPEKRTEKVEVEEGKTELGRGKRRRVRKLYDDFCTEEESKKSPDREEIGESSIIKLNLPTNKLNKEILIVKVESFINKNKKLTNNDSQEIVGKTSSPRVLKKKNSKLNESSATNEEDTANLKKVNSKIGEQEIKLVLGKKKENQIAKENVAVEKCHEECPSFSSVFPESNSCLKKWNSPSNISLMKTYSKKKSSSYTSMISASSSLMSNESSKNISSESDNFTGFESNETEKNEKSISEKVQLLLPKDDSTKKSSITTKSDVNISKPIKKTEPLPELSSKISLKRESEEDTDLVPLAKRLKTKKKEESVPKKNRKNATESKLKSSNQKFKFDNLELSPVVKLERCISTKKKEESSVSNSRKRLSSTLIDDDDDDDTNENNKSFNKIIDFPKSSTPISKITKDLKKKKNVPTEKEVATRRSKTYSDKQKLIDNGEEETSSGTEISPTRRSERKRKISSRLQTFYGPIEQVMFTGYSDPKALTLIKKLGGQIVDCPTSCTVLVTDKVRRTVKFLCALALGRPIVSPHWLTICKSSGSFYDRDQYLLKDQEAEKQFSFNLKESIEKARKKHLLEGKSIFVTNSVKPSPAEMKTIVECSGATFLTKQPSKWPQNSVIISCIEDKSIWSKFRKKTFKHPIVSAEYILSGILQQNLDAEKYSL